MILRLRLGLYAVGTSYIGGSLGSSSTLLLLGPTPYSGDLTGKSMLQYPPVITLYDTYFISPSWSRNAPNSFIFATIKLYIQIYLRRPKTNIPTVRHLVSLPTGQRPFLFPTMNTTFRTAYFLLPKWDFHFSIFYFLQEWR